VCFFPSLPFSPALLSFLSPVSGEVYCDMCKEASGWDYQNLVVSVPEVERVIHVVHDKHELSSDGVL
jgi:hypothetical protein